MFSSGFLRWLSSQCLVSFQSVPHTAVGEILIKCKPDQSAPYFKPFDGSPWSSGQVQTHCYDSLLWPSLPVLCLIPRSSLDAPAVSDYLHFSRLTMLFLPSRPSQELTTAGNVHFLLFLSLPATSSQANSSSSAVQAPFSLESSLDQLLPRQG